MRRLHRTAHACLLAVALAAGTPQIAHADCGTSIFESCGIDEQAATLEMLTRGEVSGLPKFPGDTGATVIDHPHDAPVYEYLSLNDCPEARPGTITEQVSCTHALRDCPPDQTGPLLRIWRRTLQAGKVTEPWHSVGTTCATDIAPGARPTLTMTDITTQFMRTPWATPHLTSQPPGNTTLVNLPTYYQLRWSPTGHQPGETDHATLHGIPVQIRPTLTGITYHYGDGTSHGPTTSTGGTYPHGDITHTYRHPGRYPATITITLGADYSIDNGTTWDPIPSTVTIPAPTTTITVRQARAVLVQD